MAVTLIIKLVSCMRLRARLWVRCICKKYASSQQDGETRRIRVGTDRFGWQNLISANRRRRTAYVMKEASANSI